MLWQAHISRYNNTKYKVHFPLKRKFAGNRPESQKLVHKPGVDFMNPFMLYAKLLRSTPSFDTSKAIEQSDIGFWLKLKFNKNKYIFNLTMDIFETEP